MFAFSSVKCISVLERYNIKLSNYPKSAKTQIVKKHEYTKIVQSFKNMYRNEKALKCERGRNIYSLNYKECISQITRSTTALQTTPRLNLIIRLHLISRGDPQFYTSSRQTRHQIFSVLHAIFTDERSELLFRLPGSVRRLGKLIDF
ncbi:Hypothetical_protein [Hexamita inflata]|uniref:Hypothetical_protein n=1 Tax=Hexamita inflata TaxID=28002 RepID=A0AA86R0W5_9EUKA|nr:Hypothetical protein HINF_LOCUS51368 [Hexamita inflata]